MNLTEKINRHQNLHVVFWLIKDTCWMLEVKWLGALMVIPALSIAIWITHMSRHLTEVYINLAILCWITANSYWMLVEFFNHNQYKEMAGIPFGLGFVFVGIFYFKFYKDKKATNLA